MGQPAPAIVYMPYELWQTLTIPVVEASEGGDWVCTPLNEVFKVTQNGLFQMNYMFGVEVGNSYTWKHVTFSMGTLYSIDEMTFCYNLKKNRLKLTGVGGLGPLDTKIRPFNEAPSKRGI